MPEMNKGNEVDSPAPADSTPLPRKVAGAAGPFPSVPTQPLPGSNQPTPEAVLQWIMTAQPEPWFPSAHASKTGIPRNDLDEPLNELRLAGLVRIVTWVRGAGQGYGLTPEGELAARCGPTAVVITQPTEVPASPLETTSDDGPAPIVTPAMVLANLIWFVVGLFLASGLGVPLGTYVLQGDPTVLGRLGAVSCTGLLNGEWWRLITCCFVHIGVIHLVVNLFSLASAGPIAEFVWGRWRVFVVYIFSGLAGSCLAMALRPVEPGTGVPVLLAGASGAVWGIGMSLLAWLLVYRRSQPPDVVALLIRKLTPTFLLNIGVSFLPGISGEAHLGGAIVGFLAAILLDALRPTVSLARRAVALVLLLAIPVLSVGGLVTMMASGESWARLRPQPVVEPPPNPVATFNGEVAPLLDQLAPERVRPAETVAVQVCAIDPARRPVTAARARTAITQLQTVATNAAARLSGPPTGVELVDRQRVKAQAFVDARRKSLDQLLHMLDGTTAPDVPTMKAWGASQREANRLWGELSHQ